MQYSLLLATLLLALLSLSRAGYSPVCSHQKSTTITVDQSGGGQFRTVQGAIDSIPAQNSVWTRIQVKPGFYKEKVIVPSNKPCIVLVGNSPRNTVIWWDEATEVTESATFSLYAENFKARNIAFKNTYNEKTRPGDLRSIKPAPATQITSDKVSFYQCSFIGVQDTLTDFQGRHYFKSCYIEGAADFIWGNGQSLYQNCKINASTAILGGLAGYITAQGRDSSTDNGGFVFNQCDVVGNGPVYLGRPYRPYSRVLLYKTNLPSIVVPQGWQPWNQGDQVKKITFAESKCTGPGANMSNRVKWEKTLSSSELLRLTNAKTFINQDGWLEKQPF